MDRATPLCPLHMSRTPAVLSLLSTPVVQTCVPLSILTSNARYELDLVYQRNLDYLVKHSIAVSPDVQQILKEVACEPA